MPRKETSTSYQPENAPRSPGVGGGVAKRRTKKVDHQAQLLLPVHLDRVTIKISKEEMS